MSLVTAADFIADEGCSGSGESQNKKTVREAVSLVLRTMISAGSNLNEDAT